MTTPHVANLVRVADPALHEMRDRYESFRDGGGGIVRKRDVILEHMEATPTGDALSLRALADGAMIEVTCEALGLPGDWQPFGRLRVGLQNGDERVKVELSALGGRNRIVQSAWVDAETAHVFSVDLGDLPLTAGNRQPFRPTGLRLRVQWGQTWSTEGERHMAGERWAATEDNAPVSLTWQHATLEPREAGEPTAVVDGFGQRLRGAWPTKVTDAGHFTAVSDEEARWLQRTPPPAQRDRFGGWSAGPKLEATGFFRVAEVDGRWWYVDPDGRVFWSIGTTCIRVSDTTLLEGREALFASLPKRDGEFAACYNPPVSSISNDGRGKTVVSFYLLNVLRKFGSLEAWRDRVIERFRVVGFNTVGNWSDAIMLEQQQIPHTRSLRSVVGTATVGGRHMPDVFDPAWPAALDRHVAEAVADGRDNPWLIGYFVDNELPWVGLHRKVLTTDADAPVRAALVSFLRERFKDDAAACAADLGVDASTWDGIARVQIDDGNGESFDRDALRGFVGLFAERYFETIAAALKRHDPNHLYLGCRFVRRRPHDLICAAAGRHCDVVTVNCYSLAPSREAFGAWHRATGRPIQIGEHHLPLRSERQLPPLYAAFTTDERRVLYEQFIRHWAEQPYSVGAHWFQHADQNATGRPSNGENQTVGFVDITDRPHPELVDAAMRVTRSMYGWHAAAASEPSSPDVHQP